MSRREFLTGAVALGAGWAILPRLARGHDGHEDGVWLAGDLHCHTVYSHDVWAPHEGVELEDTYTYGWTPAEQIAIAESRALDFLAITDHNNVDALTDPGYRSERLVLVPGYEHSLRRGHAGCLGVFEKLDIATDDDAGALALRDAVHALGGIFILNHPFDSKDESKSWRYSNDVRPDSIEVWNIGWPYRGANPIVSTSNNHKSLGLWEEFLGAGAMPATGGSDNHWRSTTAVQGVGQPTTWVYARERSWAAVLEAIASGRTTVSAEPPALGGARLFLTAEHGGAEYAIGDTIPSGGSPIEVAVRAHVVNAPGHLLQLVVDGVRLDPVPVLTHDFEHRVTIPVANRVRAEVYLEQGYWMAALSSPIYAA